MSQRANSLYNLINNPILYIIFQKIMSGTSFRKKIIINNIKKRRINVLDIGCGPAEILNYIPNANYYGFDIDKRSIKYAKKKYKRKNHHFFCKRFEQKELIRLPKFDFIILFGILHHLENSEIKKLLYLCKKKMKKNSKLLTEDPIFLKKQNFIAKFLIRHDRGINVREKKEYLNLVKKHFRSVSSKITHQFFIPYTWFSMTCKK